jgi:O-antigen/teichoic acid export membrane protein
LHFSATVFGIDFLKFVLSHSDKVLIGTYLNPREVGIYSVAAAIVVYVAVVLQSVNQIFAPTIADLHARQELQVLSRLFQTLTKWIIGLTLPLASVVIAFARPIMGIFGGSFESGWPILVLGTLGQLVSCGVGSVGMLLLMSGNQRRLLRVQIGMAVVMLTLNIILIPRLGILGAAIGAAVTNAGTNLWNLVEVRRVLGLSPYNRTYVRLLFPVVIMLGIIMAMRIGMTDFHHRWLVVAGALLTSYIVFVGGMLLIGLDNDDRLVLNAIRGRLRGNFQKAMGSS